MVFSSWLQVIAHTLVLSSLDLRIQASAELLGRQQDPAELAQAASTINLNNCCKTSQDATTFALVYGLPLIAFANQTTKVFSAVGGSNMIDTQRALASLEGAAVVKPNVDTLYSRVIIDLSKNDLVLTVPNITGRFWIFPFYDLFGNNFASLNPLNASQPGRYLLRRSDDAVVPPGLGEPDGSTKYKGTVNFPTTYGTMLIRILLKYNTTENLNIVHKYQDEYKLEATPRVTEQPDTPQAPAVSKLLSNGTKSVLSARQILNFLAAAAPYNQPAVLSDRYRVSSILGLAGLVNGKYTPPPGVNLAKAFTAADATIQRIVKNPRNINDLGNGWQVAYPPSEGNFGTNYAPRAYIAQNGYQQLVPYITLYPGYNGAGFSSYTLKANESFLFTFSGRPPIKPLGFWSLTVYGGDQYLVPNDLNRFEVGDRSNITYNDGTPVYGPGSDASVTDEPFKILMQAANIRPPRNWTSNWLPSPAGGGDLSFILRWYTPRPALTNGKYVYPKVEKIQAIRRN